MRGDGLIFRTHVSAEDEKLEETEKDRTSGAPDGEEEVCMTERELRRLKRSELLELLIAQIEETETLKKKLDRAEAKLASRELIIEEAGNLAEAALRLNGIFEAAQRTADQYLENIRRRTGEGEPDQ